MPSLGGQINQTIRRRPYTVLLAVVLTALAVPFCLRSATDWDGVYLAAARRLTAGQPLGAGPRPTRDELHDRAKLR